MSFLRIAYLVMPLHTGDHSNMDESVSTAITEYIGDAWDRQPDEPTLWFTRFELYRRMGPGRTMAAVWRQEKELKGEPHSTYSGPPWTRYAERWKWNERADMWDEHIAMERRLADERVAAADEAARIEMLRRHSEMACDLQRLARKRLDDLLAKADANPESLSEWEVTKMAQVVELAQRLERLGRGMPEKVTDKKSEGPTITFDRIEMVSDGSGGFGSSITSGTAEFPPGTEGSVPGE